jgi:predicted metal-dependent hydrolase
VGVVTKIAVRRRRVKHVSLRVLADGTVQITAPPGMDIDPVLSRHTGWIARQRSRLDALYAGHEGEEQCMLFRGEPCRLVAGDCCAYREAAGQVEYTTLAALKRALREWLSADLAERLERNAPRLGVSFGRVGVRMQRTRWGSCSARGNLNFNLRMMALPGDLREYIVLHELAHLKVPNHSNEYWEFLEEFAPRAREAERDLKRYWVRIERNAVWSTIRDL